MLPDIPSEDSVLYGSVLLGTGAVIYGVPKLLETEKSAPIPNQPVWRPSEPVRCALSPLAHEDIQVYDAAGMLEQKTDAYGRASLARDVTEPVTVFIGQERAQEVEWR
jgi:hypothetical protein